MVKPPKTMQPEAVDLEKAGRASGRAFQDSSFHNYMARKIDMQRNQFGVQLPPPPLSPSSPSPSTSSPQKTSPPPLSIITSPSRSVRFTLEINHESSPSKKKKRIKKSSSSASISAILERLQQRHGQGNTRLGRKRKRDIVSDAAAAALSCSKWFALEDDDESPFRSDQQEKESMEIMPPKEEAGMQHDDYHPKTVPTSVAQLPTKKEKYSSPAKEDTDDEADTEFPSSSSMSCTLSPRKLRQCRPDLFFLGIVVKVNGYTDPCNETLKRMLQKHGGDLETYETQRVTHIIAESLSKAKADIYKKKKKPLPVCTPAWIVDSVQAGKLLAHGNYMLDQLRNPEHNRIAASFFFGKEKVSSKKVHKESWTKQQGSSSDPFPGQPDGSKSTRRIMPQPQTDEVSACLDPFVTDFKECKALMRDTAAVESTSTSLKQTTTGKTLSLKGSEAEEKAQALSILEQHHSFSSAPNTEQRGQSSTPPGAFKAYNNVGGVGGDGSEDELMEFQMFGQQSPISSADPDETSGVLPFPNDAKVTVSVEIEAHQEKDSDQQVGSEMDVTSKLLHEETPAKQIIERRGRGKSDDKYINGKIRTTGTDPDFLDSFFSNSRLSFIGSYKQRTKTTGSPRKVGMDPGSSSAGLKRFVFHVDMDCFFANVVLRNFPEHRDKPVVISHHGHRASDNAHNGPEMPASKTSTSECATCNYKAREYGIKKGMYLGHARQLCPNVIVLYYDFEGYEEVSDQLQYILDSVAAGHHGCVEVVSCDEAYLELLLPDADTAGELAESIRAEIFEKTQCTASIGAGANKFLAKLGTDRVKPDGSYVVKEYRTLLESLKLRDLHGIGYRTEPKLAAEGLETVRDVWDLGDQGEGELCRILGPGLGKKVFMYCKGKDDRPVKPAERKSIGAECNYGVRFDGPYGVDHLISGLAKEVQKRMETVGVKGRRVTLKVKQRKKGAIPAGKFLGHGSCHNLSKSLETPGSSPTADVNIISRIGMALFSELAVPLDDVRGMGIMLTKLDNDNALEVQTAPTNRITNWLKKDKPGLEPLDRTKAIQRASLDDSDHKAEDRLDDEPRPTGHSADFSFGKESKTNNSAFAADTDMSQVNYNEAGLPLHFQKEIMSDAEENCQSVVDLIGVSSHFQHEPLSDDLDDYASGSGTNPSQLEKIFEATISGSSPPALTQLALPPFSQIHMSQVQALPQALQKQILARIETAEHLEDFSRERTETICIDDEDDNTMSSLDGAHPAIQDTEGPISDIFSATRKSSQAKPKKAPRLSVEQITSSARFRQSSLQRMMRLAAVKAGKETTNISLTQLDQLPLEIQLQVVNDDFCPVGSLSQRKKPPHPKERSHAPSSRTSSLQSSSGNRDSIPSMRRGEPASEAAMKDKPPSSSFEQKRQEPFDMGSQNHSTLNTEADEPIERDPRAFYLENVAPLKLFCDENSSSACDTVEQVSTFLKTCLTEGRSLDVVVLFRSVRNRADEWSNQEVLNEIARALDSEQMKVNGTRLDMDWLLGR